jgi:mannose-6-phosphate isomerase
MLTRLQEHRVGKPWGRTDIPARFGGPPTDGPLGEIWFQRPGRPSDDPLLVKYLFTSERLSVQVHPDDAAAGRSGQPRGKDEAWVILEADRDAEIGIGLNRPLSDEELRAAALDGSIVDSIDWRRVSSGDCFYSPAGTIHSIGAGLTLVEVQQNSDITYRLYDFGRPRELHLDESIDAARTGAAVTRSSARPLGPGRDAIVEGPKFTIERWSAGAGGRLDASSDDPIWLIPLQSPVTIGSAKLEPPGVWIAEGPVEPEIGAGGELLVAFQGSAIRPPA